MRGDQHRELVDPQVTADQPGRQCGRCRRLFASDPGLDPTVIADWWLCEACHHNLMGNASARPAPTPVGPPDRATSGPEAEPGR
jgi:hypothetical protein